MYNGYYADRKLKEQLQAFLNVLGAFNSINLILNIHHVQLGADQRFLWKLEPIVQ